ncbi:serine hydrolase domain-containing protein [Isoptericola halotolerans]|uniref:serine hydrolase domain-containing protein n=1 Tax=Isoptericola halotolerans TaxID=300560 RepID=UPI003891039C
MSAAAVHGHVADGYAEVAEAFAATLVDTDRCGAALSVWQDGQEVVDVWAGTADGRTGRPWTQHTPAIAFSASKSVAALVVAMLVQDGEVSYDQPVAEIWPEFAVHGKGSVTVGDLLAHRAGLSAPPGPLDREVVLDSRAWAETIAQQEPLWDPGTAHAYHALTLGPLVAEIVRRVTGTELADVVRERVATPLDAATTFAPTAGAVTTASGLARILSAVVTPTRGVHLLDGETVAAVCRPRSSGHWAFPAPPGPYPVWGAGMQVVSEVLPGLSPSSFGHGGAGGQVALADPERRTGMAYVRNRMDSEGPGPGLTAALRAKIRS